MKFEKRIVNGKEHLISKVEFDLGEIKTNLNNNENGIRSVIMPMGIKFSMQILNESIKNAILNDDIDNFDKHLEEYCRLYLNDVIGVESYPIHYSDDNKIIGIKKNAELIIE